MKKMRKTFLEKLTVSRRYITSYKCVENEHILVLMQEGEVLLLEHENSTSAVVLGLEDLKRAVNKFDKANGIKSRI